jgi:hypothetical protein
MTEHLFEADDEMLAVTFDSEQLRNLTKLCEMSIFIETEVERLMNKDEKRYSNMDVVGDFILATLSGIKIERRNSK